MKRFIQKHHSKITGTLSCFDRVLFKGHLPITWGKSMENFISGQGLLIKDFKNFVVKHSASLTQHAKTAAAKAARPYIFLRKPVRKEKFVRKIAYKDGITSGLVCVLSAVEGCQSFKLAYGKGRPRIISAARKCLCLYFYFIDPTFGFMHIRIQTWFPFTIQICLNGHDWLARKLDKHGITYRRPIYQQKSPSSDNVFFRIEDPVRAQRFADRFSNLQWPRILPKFAARVNPLLKNLLTSMDYYWCTDQAEFATDVIFKDRNSLKPLYEKLLKHAALCLSSEDVMSFLGKKLHGGFTGEVISNFKKRWPGSRIKHRMKQNWIKMYDKLGCVLRIETVINHPYDFKVRRRGICKGQQITGWYPMPKGVAHLWRYAEVSLSSNGRYLNALSVVDDPADAFLHLHRLVKPVQRNGRPFRGFNPASVNDVRLFAAVMRGEHSINGFRNICIRRHLYQTSNNSLKIKRQSAAVSRLLKRLHVRNFIAKFPRSRRWRVTKNGFVVMSMVLKLYHEIYPNFIVNLSPSLPKCSIQPA